MFAGLEDDAARFAERVVAVLRDAAGANERAAEVRRWAQERYGAPRALESLRAIYLDRG